MAPRTRRSVARPAAPKPAPKAEAPKAESAPKADFSNLAVVETDPIARTRNLEHNPFTAHVKASHERQVTLAVPVNSEDDAKQAVNMIRRAAKVLDLGVSVLVTPQENGTFKVSFAGKNRRQYTRKSE